MAQYMCWLFLIFFVFNKIPFASGRAFKSGEYKYLHRHPKLKSCAMEVFEENIYVGCRVHVQKGDCEGLNHSWAINQTTESGYAYAKKQWVESSFIPPIETSEERHEEAAAWVIPGVLSAGSKVETTVTVLPGHQRTQAALTARDMDYRYLGRLKAWYSTGPLIGNTVILAEEIPIANGSGTVELQRDIKILPIVSTKERKVKITFLSLTDGLMMLVENQTFLLKNLTVDLMTVKDIKVSPHLYDNKPPRLHGFKFTGV